MGLNAGPGRPPKPTALKILEGNPGKRPLTEKEPKPPTGELTPPEFLDDGAVEEWNRVYPELRSLGLVTVIDRTTLAAYCQSYSDYDAATQKLKTDGKTFVTPNGHIQTSPWVTQARQAKEDMIRIGSLLGFNPSSRTKLSVAPETMDGDGLLLQ